MAGEEFIIVGEKSVLENVPFVRVHKDGRRLVLLDAERV